MIHHNVHRETYTQRIGVQKDNLEYTYLHWRPTVTSSRFTFRKYTTKLNPKEYRPIGPTLLVEWGDE